MIEQVAAPRPHGSVPVDPDPDGAEFWDGLAAGRLRLPRCRSCARVWSPPTARCPHCGAESREWCEVSGTGRLYSWVVVRRALDEAFAADVPYTVAVVTLDGTDGARLVGRLLGEAADTAHADMAVRTVSYRVAERSLPAFVAATTPAPGHGGGER